MNLRDHLTVKEQDRNYTWDEKFFKLISESEVALLSQDPQQGPDGWPYIICETLTDNNQKKHDVDSIDSVQKVIHWLSTRGIGLVVNPYREPYPDYVFSYGMIWSFKETGFFMRPDLAQQSGEIAYENNKITTGAPTEQYLPLYVRKVLKDFFRDQGVLIPKILMISPDQKNYDLAFSLESLGNPPASEHAGIAEAISWFLPPHYSVVLISENNLPAFADLYNPKENYN
ncbi:MAG: hypothetical protein ACK41T_07295 [Pseudobdellovibrio sp.]